MQLLTRVLLTRRGWALSKDIRLLGEDEALDHALQHKSREYARVTAIALWPWVVADIFLHLLLYTSGDAKAIQAAYKVALAAKKRARR